MLGRGHEDMAETPSERRSSGLHLELIPIDQALLEEMAKVWEKSTVDTTAYEEGTGSPVDNFRSYNQHTPPQGTGYVGSARYGIVCGIHTPYLNRWRGSQPARLRRARQAAGYESRVRIKNRIFS